MKKTSIVSALAATALALGVSAATAGGINAPAEDNVVAAPVIVAAPNSGFGSLGAAGAVAAVLGAVLLIGALGDDDDETATTTTTMGGMGSGGGNDG